MTKQQERTPTQDSAMVSDERLEHLRRAWSELSPEVYAIICELQDRRSAAPPSEEMVRALEDCAQELDEIIRNLGWDKPQSLLTAFSAIDKARGKKATEPRAEKDHP